MPVEDIAIRINNICYTPHYNKSEQNQNSLKCMLSQVNNKYSSPNYQYKAPNRKKYHVTHELHYGFKG